MEKTIGKEYKNALQREAFLKDNCDAVENKGYMKKFTLLSPGANQTLEDVRDRAIDEQLGQIKTIAQSIAIIEI